MNVAGENDNKTVLDAFFLGKALGEALTERLESAVGEILSTIGRLQAEQQKQVQEFQVRTTLVPILMNIHFLPCLFLCVKALLNEVLMTVTRRNTLNLLSLTEFKSRPLLSNSD